MAGTWTTLTDAGVTFMTDPDRKNDYHSLHMGNVEFSLHGLRGVARWPAAPLTGLSSTRRAYELPGSQAIPVGHGRPERDGLHRHPLY